MPLRSLPKETYIAAFSAAGIAGYFLLGIVPVSALWQRQSPLYAVLLLGGAPLLVDLLRRVWTWNFGADILAGLSIVTSAILGEYLAGSIVVLMLSGGVALEQYAMRRASAVLGALAKRMPRVAHRQSAAGLADISLDEVQAGELLVVLPHETCPVDGVVEEGRGSMDESYLTGEPYQIDKVPGAEVMSGAINGEHALTIRASRLPVDSRYAKIMHVMREAETNRPEIRRVADRLGAWYTPAALALAGIGWLISGDPIRFLAVLVIATPCPLLLAIPVAILGAISVAASRAIIIRNPSMLERIDSCSTVIFDKTGTLTYGRPALVDIQCADGFSEDEAVRLAAALERYSKHPLAAPILERAKLGRIDLPPVLEVGERPGEGLRGRIDSSLVRILGRKQVLGSPDITGELPQPAPGLECILVVDGKYAATFRFRDTPRSDSKAFVRHLTPKHAVKRMMLLSGDREREVRYLAGEVGITEAVSGKSPEEKVDIVRAEAALAPTLFLGDGINDAPAMQAATVGIAFGQHSDVTSEAADAVVLEPSLRKVDELIHIGRRLRRIALQSAVGGMSLSVAGMALAALGYLPPVAGAIAQEAIDVGAVLNALRMAFPSTELNEDGLGG